ncbi:MAG: tripartite tricarboxylate transporter substrate binding protein [Pigmentiphaga sp.]|nr:tripartite tricarboxylate transporter substrate binding protein [Pigmentiphaga sp.]
MATARLPAWFSRLAILATGLGVLTGGTALAAYPDKPIRVVVPFNAGSGSDNVARKLTGMVGEARGWTFIVDNRPGASGTIGARAAAEAPADGYTLFYTGNTTHGANSALFKQLPYDPVADFDPIIRVGVFPLVLLTRPTLEVASVTELTEHMRSAATPLTFAEGSAGPRVAAERFLHEADVPATHVPYKSSPQALADLIGGHVDFTFLDTVAAMPMIQNNTLRPLALTSRQPIERLPGVKTMDELGFPGFEVQNWSALFVPDGTPADIVQTLHEAFASAISSADWQAFVSQLGAYADLLTPEQTAEWVASEIKQYQEVLARAGVVPE